MSTENKEGIVPNQIWLCKKSYNDSLGNLIEGSHEFYVFITSIPEKLNDEWFVRVQPISLNIDFKLDDDVLITDKELLGASFIIEAWNEQPILTNVLEKYIGAFEDYYPYIIEPGTYTEEQLEFRKGEIRNSSYLRQSVLSNLAYNESKKNRRNIEIYWPQLLIAASLIAVLLLLWQPTKIPSKKALELYAYVSPDKIALIETEDQLRGTEYLVPGMSPQNSESAIEGLTYFDIGDFNNAVGSFERIDSLNSHPDILLYLAIAQLKSNRSIDAIKNFEYLTLIKDFKSDELVNYYLSLVYLESGKILIARKLLRELVTEEGEYAERAKMILSKIRWF